MTMSQELSVAYLTEDIEDKLANLPLKALATETDNNVTQRRLFCTAVLISWKDLFPDGRENLRYLFLLGWMMVSLASKQRVVNPPFTPFYINNSWERCRGRAISPRAARPIVLD